MSTPNKRKNLNNRLNRVPISPGRQVVNEAANAKKVFIRHLNKAFKSIGLNTRIPYNSPAKKPKH
jgi:hypothetical protein